MPFFLERQVVALKRPRSARNWLGSLAGCSFDTGAQTKKPQMQLFALPGSSAMLGSSSRLVAILALRYSTSAPSRSPLALNKSPKLLRLLTVSGSSDARVF